MIFAVAVTSFSWWQQRNGVELRYLERVRAVTLALDDELDESIRMLRAMGDEAGMGSEGPDVYATRLRRALRANPLWSAAAVGDRDWAHVAVSARGDEAT